TPDQDEETWEYTVVIPPVIDVSPPTNVTTPTITGTGAFPRDGMDVTVGGLPCVVPPAVDATWSCTVGAPLADGIHQIVANQTVAGATSSQAVSAITIDTVSPGLP